MEIKIIFKRYDSRLELKDTNNLLVLVLFRKHPLLVKWCCHASAFHVWIKCQPSYKRVNSVNVNSLNTMHINVQDNILQYYFVPAIRCDRWPSQAKKWNSRQRKNGWPSTSLIDQCMLSECHVVPVGHSKIDTPHINISLYTFMAWYRYFNTKWRG
jgi:hypothetical protein